MKPLLKILIIGVAALALSAHAMPFWRRDKDKCSFKIADAAYRRLFWVAGQPMPLHRFRILAEPDRATSVVESHRVFPLGSTAEIIQEPYAMLREQFGIKHEVTDIDADHFEFHRSGYSVVVSREITQLDRMIAILGLREVPHPEYSVNLVGFSDGSFKVGTAIKGDQFSVTAPVFPWLELHDFVMQKQRQGHRVVRILATHNHTVESIMIRRGLIQRPLFASHSPADQGSFHDRWIQLAKVLSLTPEEMLSEPLEVQKIPEWDFSQGISLESRVVLGADMNKLVTITMRQSFEPKRAVEELRSSMKAISDPID